MGVTAGIVGFSDLNNAEQEGPHFVRLRKADLQRRINDQLTLEVDGSVVSTGLKVEGARRGFNPHRRRVPSYYPITAYEANTGQVLRVGNRAGNVHDGQGFGDLSGRAVRSARCDA